MSVAESYWRWSRRALLGAVGAAAFFGASPFALAQATQDLVEELETKVEQDAGADMLQSLRRYRLEIEQHAYRDTLALCEGYRFAAGMESTHNPRMIPLSESAAVWRRVAQEGLLLPFSENKATFLETQSSPSLSREAWLGSMYALYLVHSMGFLQGAMHCLGTMDQAQLNRFASAIAYVDVQATVATYGTTVLAGDGIFALLSRANWLVLRPLAHLQNLLRLRLSRTQWLVLGGAVGAILVDSVFERLREIERLQSYVLASTPFLSEREMGRLDRLQKLQNTTALLRAAMNQPSARSRGDLATALAELAQDPAYKSDYQMLMNQPDQQRQDPVGQLYFELLRLIVPLFP